MKLKSVILFNTKDDSFSIIGYNYLPEEASVEENKLRRDNLPAFTILQPHRFEREKEVENLVNQKMKRIKDKIKG